jgi:hypothetical protein
LRFEDKLFSRLVSVYSVISRLEHGGRISAGEQAGRVREMIDDMRISPNYRAGDWTKLNLSLESPDADWQKGIDIFQDRMMQCRQ